MIHQMEGLPLPVQTIPRTVKQASKTPTIQNVQELSHPRLVKYIQSRGISLELAQMYLSEVHY